MPGVRGVAGVNDEALPWPFAEMPPAPLPRGGSSGREMPDDRRAGRGPWSSARPCPKRQDRGTRRCARTAEPPARTSRDGSISFRVHMRRHILIVAACLVTGAFLTLATSFSIVATSPVPIKQSPLYFGTTSPHAGSPWIEPAPPDWPGPIEDYRISGGGMWTYQAWGGMVPEYMAVGYRPTVGMLCVRVGFPFPAMAWSERYDRRENPIGHWDPCAASAWERGVTPGWVSNTVPDGPRIPLRPMPLGFLANSLLYALVIWGGAWVVALARREYRQHRVNEGRCSRCGYSLRGLKHPRCPECGAPFP
jgi:hypothetical protein